MSMNESEALSWVTELYRLGLIIARSPDPDAARNGLLGHVVRGFKADSGTLALCLGSAEHLTIVAGIDLPAGTLGKKIAVGESIIGWVARHGEALLLDGDAATDPRFVNLLRRDPARIPVSSMCWPLIAENQVLGVFSVNRTRRPFVEDELILGKSLMGLLALVVENSSLAQARQEHIAALSAANRELTELNRKLELTEVQLRHAEQDISLIVNCIGEAVYGVDRAGNVTFVNPAMVKMLGWPAQELIGKPIHGTVHHTRPDGSPYPKEECPLYHAYLESRFCHREDQQFFHRDGRAIPVECTSTPLLRDGQPEGAVVVFRDITEKLLAQRAREAYIAQLTALNHKLEEAQNQLLQSEKMASIGQLAAGVAHEINNPVGFVNSNLNTLKKYSAQMLELIEVYRSAEGKIGDAAMRAKINDLKQALDIDFLRDDLPDLIRESEDGLTRVKKIVQDLKDFSHVDEQEWQFADLNAGLESTLNVVWNEVKYKAKVEKHYGELPEVECLIAQLNQVFMNLIVNAVHAIDESLGMGTITLSTGHENEWVWVEVKDSGRGMSPEVQKRVFEPFFTTKPVGKGTGLGLSLSFSIVQKHGGRIELKSAPGVGSAFKVWVPVKHFAGAATDQNKEKQDAGIRTGG